jgi:hypothetical protein
MLENTEKIRYRLNAVPEKSTDPSVTELINNGIATPNIGYALNPTDFFGEYILAKKKCQ